jgi:hypothetical protein
LTKVEYPIPLNAANVTTSKMVVKAVENKRKTWQVHLPKVNAPHYKAIYIGKLNIVSITKF